MQGNEPSFVQIGLRGNMPAAEVTKKSLPNTFELCCTRIYSEAGGGYGTHVRHMSRWGGFLTHTETEHACERPKRIPPGDTMCVFGHPTLDDRVVKSFLNYSFWEPCSPCEYLVGATGMCNSSTLHGREPTWVSLNRPTSHPLGTIARLQEHAPSGGNHRLICIIVGRMRTWGVEGRVI